MPIQVLKYTNIQNVIFDNGNFREFCTLVGEFLASKMGIPGGPDQDVVHKRLMR